MYARYTLTTQFSMCFVWKEGRARARLLAALRDEAGRRSETQRTLSDRRSGVLADLADTDLTRVLNGPCRADRAERA